MKMKNRGREGKIALKLDISKAYDRVSWKFLRHRLQAMNFSDKWIGWMLFCVKTLSYHFCLNGSLLLPIIPNRGLRQGDSLSPYLFLLCVEGLSNAIDSVTEAGQIHGCRISPRAPAITHLLFAYESFLFFRANKEEALVVKEVLSRYERDSGQYVNYLKLGVYFRANVHRDKQQEISGILGVHNGITGTNYPGLPSLVGRSKKHVFGYLKEKVRESKDGKRNLFHEQEKLS